MMKKLARVLGLLLGVLLVAVGGFVAATWAPDRSVEELSPRWAPSPSRFVDSAGMRVHLRDEGPPGDPLPIVLLHGTSASLHTWDGWAEQLRASRRVIRIDLPGFGLTGPFPDGDYTIEHYVSFLGDLLAQLGVRRCVVAGNSFGGHLAWALASRTPALVERLILVDAAGYPMRPKSMPIGFRLARMPLVGGLFEHILPRRIIESSVRNVYGDPTRVTPQLVDRYYELTLRAGNRRAVIQRFKQAPTSSVDSQRIAALHLPTLILWGRRDGLIPVENAERFHTDIGGSQLVVFDDLGHVPHEEDPGRTVAAVQAFLR